MLPHMNLLGFFHTKKQKKNFFEQPNNQKPKTKKLNTNAKATCEPENRGPESDSDIEIIAEVPMKPKPRPKIIDIDGVGTEEPIGKIKLEPKIEPGVNAPTQNTSTENTAEL